MDMNMVMKMMKIKTIEDKYNDLSDLTSHWQHFYMAYDEHNVVDLLCEVDMDVLERGEKLYRKMQRRKWIKQIPMKIVRFALSMISQDEFEGRYKK